MLRHDLIGQVSEPIEHSWGPDDIMLYALGVGAGQNDPAAELDYTTENTEGSPLKALPTFANMLMRGDLGPLGDYHPSALVHGEQSFELHSALQVSGRSNSTVEIVSIHDKGSAALITRRYRIVDAASGEPLATAEQGLFIRGEGGFGGPPAPQTAWSAPETAPDHIVEYRTRNDQALLYRLTGDRNPLHSDPKFARRGGFEQPILHGMCTYGYAGRALLHTLCDDDPERFGRMEARFTRPVMPGDQLRVEIWTDVSGGRFRVHNQDGPVLDRGVFRTR